jgi:hypothetical protein
VSARPADNPFASRRIDSLRYRHRDLLGRDLLRCLARNGRRGAIVGPHGSGKTTLLEEIAPKLDGRVVWIRLTAGTDQPFDRARAAVPPSIDRDHTVLFDGAEQLGPWAWRRFRRSVRNAGAVVITCHTPGRLPTIHECRTDFALLEELVTELAPETADAVDLEALFQRHDGNIRLCFRELYDLHAGR